MRLSIEITQEQHRKLKATASMQGKSIKDYVLDRTLPDSDEEAALKELEVFLQPRVEEALRGERSSKSVDDIVAETLREQQTR
ncbi:MAG: DUF1778 domain-containing protein [Gammaproteobacteria bacterium]|nr:DUF1778 domain-containing protein [Gammaproteobacteria bacterium]